MVTERQVQNQAELKVYGNEDVKPNQTSKNLTEQVSSGQVMRVQMIEIEAPPQAKVTLKYKDEIGSNDITIGEFYVYEFPLVFKPTSTDNHLVIWEDRSLSFQVTNTLEGQITVRARLTYIKVYRDK